MLQKKPANMATFKNSSKGKFKGSAKNSSFISVVFQMYCSCEVLMQKLIKIVIKHKVKTTDGVVMAAIEILRAIDLLKSETKNPICLKDLRKALENSNPEKYPKEQLCDPILFMEKMHLITEQLIFNYGSKKDLKQAYFKMSYCYSLYEDNLSETMHTNESNFIELPILSIAPILEEMADYEKLDQGIEGKLFHLSNCFYSDNTDRHKLLMKHLVKKGICHPEYKKCYDFYSIPKYATFKLNFDTSITVEEMAKKIDIFDLMLLFQYVPLMIPEYFEVKRVMNLITSEDSPNVSFSSENDLGTEENTCACTDSEECKHCNLEESPQKVSIPKIEANPNKLMAKLCSIVAYTNNHFVNFSRRGENWYLFDDHKVKKLGDYSNVTDCMINSAFLPYILLYETYEKSRSELSLVMEKTNESRSTVNQFRQSNLEDSKFTESELVNSNGIYQHIRKESKEGDSNLTCSRSSKMPVNELPIKVPPKKKRGFLGRFYDYWCCCSKDSFPDQRPKGKKKGKNNSSNSSSESQNQHEELKMSD